MNRTILRRLADRLAESGHRAAADAPMAAIVWVTLSMALLAGIAAVVRMVTAMGLDSQVAFFWRNVFCVIWLTPLVALRGRALFVTGQPRLYALRVGLSFVSMSAFFYALSEIPIGKATAIGFLSPLFAAAFAILLLGEAVGPRRWLGLLIGFAGAMIMLGPWQAWGATPSGALGWGEAAALLSAMCVGIIGPLVKQLTRADDADRIVFITSILMTPVSLVPALYAWSWPTGQQWGLLVLLGLLAVLGHMTLVRGYVATDASLVATFKFSRLPFAVALGYVLFGESITLSTWIGACVIFAASIYIARRETAQQRTQSPSSVAD